MRPQILCVCLLACCLSFDIASAQTPAAAVASSSQTSLLGAAEAARIMPTTVFFRGQSAPVQGRNSGGLRLTDNKLMLVSLVDTSGYSTQVQEKYQAYLITEAALVIGGHTLPAGAYGCGFIAGDTFVVQDIGAHDLFTARSIRDAELRRPTPLQVVAEPGTAGKYRLYAGRNYVAFSVAGH